MSYANGTTHYNLPQTVGTDKRDWFDTNQAFADIDEALYGAVQQSTSTATSLTALTTRVGNVESDVATIQSSQSTDEANIAALQTLTSQHTTQIADVKADALDMICAVDEGTAQVATVAVSSGDYFRYNDVLYMATANIAVGDTIVPNTNCRATNVATELASISEHSSAISVIVDDLPSEGGAFTCPDMDDYSYIYAELRYGSGTIASVMSIPIALFKAATHKYEINIYVDTNTTRTLDIKYVNDTTVNIGFNAASSIYVALIK